MQLFSRRPGRPQPTHAWTSVSRMARNKNKSLAFSFLLHKHFAKYTHDTHTHTHFHSHHMQIILGAERNGSHQKLILWVKGGRQTAIHIFVWIEAKVCFAYFSSSSRRTPYFSLNFWFIFVGNWLTQNDGLARGFDVFYSQRLVLFCRVCVCIEGLLCFFLYKRILCRCLTHTHTHTGGRHKNHL